MNDLAAISEIAVNFGPVVGPLFVMWYVLTRNGADPRKDVVTELDGKVDAILDRLARLETRFDERFRK